MAIQKKSLIGNLSATKKAIVATNVASTTPVAKGLSVETAKGEKLFMKGHHKLAMRASFTRATAKVTLKKK